MHTGSCLKVAIKKINMVRVRKDMKKGALEMVKTEVKILQKLSKRVHQNVIKISDVITVVKETDDGKNKGERVHIVMELIKGCSLRRLMDTVKDKNAKNRCLPPKQMCSYCRQMLDGIAHCHALGVIH